jgi:hypothetical protein
MRTVVLSVPLLLAGCGAIPPGGIARAQQSAQEFNMDARFGRSDFVLERVAPAAREDYATHHRAWGTEVHVADVEMAGMRAKNEHEVKVLVRVSWYRGDQQELRGTTLEQVWHDKLMDWELVSEKRVDGDVGLLGEAIVYAEPEGARKPARFPTIRLGAGDDSPAKAAPSE